VGTPESVEGVSSWLTRCRREIAAKPSRQPNLFPRFPGFAPDVAFRSSLVIDPQLQRTISPRTVEALARNSDRGAAVRDCVRLVAEEFRSLVDKAAVDVLICASPTEILSLTESLEDAGSTESTTGTQTTDPPEFHDLLKAAVMEMRVPVQVVRPSTYDASKRKRSVRGRVKARPIQDDATVAWNFHTALYYKAGGRPWRLVRDPTRHTSCYVGVSFFYSADKSKLLTSMAQVFDERGDGLIVRGGPAKTSKDDRHPYLDEEDACRLMREALARYRDEHKHLPARVVVHKSSRFEERELAGFRAGLGDQIELADFVSLRPSAAARLFRYGVYPPLRGTLLFLSERRQVLYSRGSVPFFETYPGLYVPRPIEIVCAEVSEATRTLASEVLALTKMNWNASQFDHSQPITLEGARCVGKILRCVPEGAALAARYSFYM
jgi:hypothetical protein